MAKQTYKAPVPYYLAKNGAEERPLHDKALFTQEEEPARSAMFLTPATATTKGEVIEVQRRPARSAQARQFVEPVPYWQEERTATNDAAEIASVAPEPLDRTGQLTPEQQAGLEAERSMLLQRLPSLTGKAWTEAEARIEAIEQELQRARSNERAERRHEERATERERQYAGQRRAENGAATAFVTMGGGTAGHGGRQLRARLWKPAADPFKQAVEQVQKAAPGEFRSAVASSIARGASVHDALVEHVFND